MFITYVLGVAIDPQEGIFGGLTKGKGPVYLLNRHTFPGGKTEGDELPCVAISREYLEEAGIYIAPEDWKIISDVRTEEYRLVRLAARSSLVKNVRQMEAEPVWVGNIAEELARAATHPGEYVDDFIPSLQGALMLLNI